MKDGDIKKLVFAGSEFAYIEASKGHGLANPCCDTISYGHWKRYDPGYIILNSPDELKTFFVNCHITEKTDRSPDTIYFYIKDPIQEENEKNHNRSNELSYQLNVSAVGGFSGSFKENRETFDTSEIKYSNPDKLSIDNFSVSASANCSMYVKNIAVRTIFTLPYKVKDPTSNVFEIQMPQVTYNFFSSRRLNDDFVKVLGPKRLLWDGMEFVQE
jgi:hypothetical protein